MFVYITRLHYMITMQGAKNITLERLNEYERTFSMNFYSISFNTFKWWAARARSVQRFASGWTVWGSNPVGGPDFPHSSILAVRSTQPPVQWVPGLFP